MKVSVCHTAKMIRHSVTGAQICSVCGYAGSIDIDTTKYKKKKVDNKIIFEKKFIPLPFSHDSQT